MIASAGHSTLALWLLGGALVALLAVILGGIVYGERDRRRRPMSVPAAINLLDEEGLLEPGERESLHAAYLGRLRGEALLALDERDDELEGASRC